MSRLENWSEYGKCVVGEIFGDNRFPDGSFITTSEVKTLDREAKTLQTRNTLYELGKEMEWKNNDSDNQG